MLTGSYPHRYQHGPITGDTGPSKDIFGKYSYMAGGLATGCLWFADDFVASQSYSADSEVTFPYQSYIDTSNTIIPLPLPNGIMRMSLDATDNDETWIQPGGGGGAPFIINTLANGMKPLIFEARVKKSSIANDAIAMFIGLAEENSANADSMVDDTGVLKTTADWIGFHVLQAAGATVRFVYQTAGQTLQALIATAATAVADTYLKLGFVIDPNFPASQRGKIYVDGVEQTTYLTDTLIEAATFPNGEEMSPIWGCKLGAASARTAELDWWYCGTERA